MKRVFVILLGVLFASFAMLSAQEVVIYEEMYDVVEEEEIGHDIVLGLNSGLTIPLGQNIKDLFDLGIPVSLTVEVPELAPIQDMSLYAGLNLGYFMASGSEDNIEDMSGIVVTPYCGLDMSNFVPENMKLAVELGLGGYFLDRYESYSAFGINGFLVYGYDVSDFFSVTLKVGANEILAGPAKDADGTMEWVDVRLGVEYAIPKILPF
ncbi:MAG: hypothetical protein PHE86_02720 [Candidatus Marinimicrobia bacterium]|nr:hypothetical protein [Candidatus Neomarinimicrobiota bacterium]MDD5582409.1 hypothetical protein [Candidatus Neomarinimicrobiota bacterium]